MTDDRLTEIRARDTHYAALNCRECGHVLISEDEYNRQISNPAALWMCPECGRVADFDDSYFEDHHGLIGDDMQEMST